MKRLLTAVLSFASVATLSAASITYHVSVDSSGIAPGTAGYIEFQFNQPNELTSLGATAALSNFTAPGFSLDDAGNLTLGGVSGSLTTPPLILDNTGGAANRFDQRVTAFASGFSFDVALSGAALTTAAPDGSELVVFLLATNFDPLMLGDGQVASILINGNPSVMVNPTALSTIVEAVPEPATVLTSLGGMALLLGACKLRKCKLL